MAETSAAGTRAGYLFGLVAYLWWGLVPLYFLQVRDVPPLEILAHRIVWSILVLAGLTSILGNWPAVRAAVRSPKLLRTMALSAALLAVNWLLYIYATVSHQVAEASLGYFMMPLANAFLGRVFLGERLRPAHYPALAVVAVGVAIPAVSNGAFPLLAVALTVSFGLYGLVRKTAPIDSSTGLMVESLVLLPASVGYLAYLTWTGSGKYGPELPLNLWLMASGIVTVVPLVTFALSIRRLPLLAVSFIQFVSPTVQLLLAVFYLGEARTAADWQAMGCVWAAVLIFVADAVVQARRRNAHGRKSVGLPRLAVTR